MNDLIDFFLLLLESLVLEVSDLINKTKRLSRKYLRGLKKFALWGSLFGIILPILIAAIASSFGGWWITGWAGVWCSLFLIILAVCAAPLGIIIDTLIPGGPAGSPGKILMDAIHPKRKIGEGIGARYVAFAQIIILWETATFFILSVVPVKNNPKMISVCILGVICLALMAYRWKQDNKWAKSALRYFTLIVVGGGFLTFLYPALIPHFTPDGVLAGTKTVAEVGVKNADFGIEGGAMRVLVTWAIFGIMAWYVCILVQKAANKLKGESSHASGASSGHGGGDHGGGHGGGGGGSTNVFGTIIGIFVILAVAGLVLNASPTLRNLTGQSAEIPMQAGERPLKPYGLTTLEAIEGLNLFHFTSRNQVARLYMPQYAWDASTVLGQNLWIRTDKHEGFVLCSPLDLIPGSLATNVVSGTNMVAPQKIEWLEMKLPETEPSGKMSLVVTRKYN